MAEGYECDRCGSLHSGTPHTLLTVGDGMERDGPQDRHTERYVNEGMEMGDEYYDVCPGCRSEFEEWWNNE